MKKTNILLKIFIFTSITTLNARYEKIEKTDYPVKIDWFGFVRSDAFFDSRQVVAFRFGLELIYPKEQKLDKFGCDINATGKSGFSPCITRLDIEAVGPELFGTKVTGLIEAEFYGIDDFTAGLFDLRHALVFFEGKTQSLLIGQYWHPFTMDNCAPQVISNNSGEPMAPNARSPQILYMYQTDNFESNTTIFTQFMDTDTGPIGFTPEYSQNAILPGLNQQFVFKKNENNFIAISGNVKRIRPRLSINDQRTTASLTSYSGSVWARITTDKFALRSQAVYSQNGRILQMMSGYAVECKDPDGLEKYTNIDAAAWWVDLQYNYSDRFEPGLFVGYTKNVGASSGKVFLDNDGLPIFYGFDSRLDYVGRVSARVLYQFKNLQIGTEIEYTRAGFGPMQSDGKVNKENEAENIRALISFIYLF